MICGTEGSVCEFQWGCKDFGLVLGKVGWNLSSKAHSWTLYSSLSVRLTLVLPSHASCLSYLDAELHIFTPWAKSCILRKKVSVELTVTWWALNSVLSLPKWGISSYEKFLTLGMRETLLVLVIPVVSHQKSLAKVNCPMCSHSQCCLSGRIITEHVDAVASSPLCSLHLWQFELSILRVYKMKYEMYMKYAWH